MCALRQAVYLPQDQKLIQRKRASYLGSLKKYILKILARRRGEQKGVVTIPLSRFRVASFAFLGQFSQLHPPILINKMLVSILVQNFAGDCPHRI